MFVAEGDQRDRRIVAVVIIDSPLVPKLLFLFATSSPLGGAWYSLLPWAASEVPLQLIVPLRFARFSGIQSGGLCDFEIAVDVSTYSTQSIRIDSFET